MIAKVSIEQLKSRLNIVEILSQYIQLKRVGVNYSACCPFHGEKTPSFIVSPAKGIYHCYGCGVGGDAIAFVMEYEKLSFIESIEKIASMIGYSLTYTQEKPKKDSRFLDEIAQFYHSKLLELPEVLQYLKDRGISSESLGRFLLGFCGMGFESVKFADARHARMEAIELGVLGKDGDRVYSRFFDRLMFPICSNDGRVIGFGGRSLQKESKAKYINSPQSKIFNKSRLLYAYHLAKESIYSKNEIIIVEGYIDVIMMHQAGFKNVVATLGTALGKDHLPLLSRGEPRVIVSYDGDKAGINAAYKASRLLALSGKEGGVVIFDGGADPADMVAQGRIQEITTLLQSPIPFVDFVFDQMIKAYDLNQPLQKEKALKEALEFLHSLSPVLQQEYRGFLAGLLHLPSSLIRLKKASPITAIPKQIDLSELTLIKTLLENPSFINFALEYLDTKSFQIHSSEFSLILKEKWDDPALLGIRINPNIEILDFENFKKQIGLFLIKDYEQRLKKIPFQKQWGYEKKMQEVMKYRKLIEQIKRGEF